MDELSLSQIAANRAALYHWFAMAFFAPPTLDEVIDMRQGKAQRLLQSLAATPGAGPGVDAMSEVLDAAAPATVVSALGVAHARLFFGVGVHEATPPYRSVYSSEQGLLCQHATAEMERVLRQHRLRLQDAVNEPSDHVSIQLEVMAQLALRYAEAAAENSDALAHLQAEQAAFLDEQLLSWLPAFARRVTEADELGFHAGLANVLVPVLAQDLAFLRETLDAPA